MIEIDDRLSKKFRQQMDEVYAQDGSNACVLLRNHTLSVRTQLPY